MLPVIWEPHLLVGLGPVGALDLGDILPELPVQALEDGGGQAGQVGDTPQAVEERSTAQLLQLQRENVI